MRCANNNNFDKFMMVFVMQIPLFNHVCERVFVCDLLRTERLLFSGSLKCIGECIF